MDDVRLFWLPSEQKADEESFETTRVGTKWTAALRVPNCIAGTQYHSIFLQMQIFHGHPIAAAFRHLQESAQNTWYLLFRIPLVQLILYFLGQRNQQILQPSKHGYLSGVGCCVVVVVVVVVVPLSHNSIAKSVENFGEARTAYCICDQNVGSFGDSLKRGDTQANGFVKPSCHDQVMVLQLHLGGVNCWHFGVKCKVHLRTPYNCMSDYACMHAQ